MTINVGLVTSDALVLGSDSIASVHNYFLDPLALKWEADANGDPIQDANGKFTVKFDEGDWQQVVVNTYGGVTKLFQIHDGAAPMVAATAGLAKLCDRPMASWGAEFLASSTSRALTKANEVCEAFLSFMRSKYDEHYKGSPLPDALKEGPEFLIGGFGGGDQFPSLFRLKVKENTCAMAFGAGNKNRTGISWNGQSDAVERFIRGYDAQMRIAFNGKVTAALEEHGRLVNEYVAETINRILDATGQKMPDGIDVQLPILSSIPFAWSDYRTSIDFANLPHQEAINFVAFLILLQDGRARFARGVPTVGGRTHIAIVTRDKGLQFLNEPELTHRYTGFGDDQ